MEETAMTEVALFGAGRIGKIHAGNVARQTGVKLRYVIDVDAAAAGALAATGSQMNFRLTPGSAATLPAWMRPMRPAPKTATFFMWLLLEVGSPARWQAK